MYDVENYDFSNDQFAPTQFIEEPTLGLFSIDEVSYMGSKESSSHGLMIRLSGDCGKATVSIWNYGRDGEPIKFQYRKTMALMRILKLNSSAMTNRVKETRKDSNDNSYEVTLFPDFKGKQVGALIKTVYDTYKNKERIKCEVENFTHINFKSTKENDENLPAKDAEKQLGYLQRKWQELNASRAQGLKSAQDDAKGQVDDDNLPF